MIVQPFDVTKPIVGMVHLGPLPGSARDSGDLDQVIARAVADARTLAAAGIDGLMVENFFDAPFCKSRVPPATIAAITRAILAVREAVDLPIGVNVLRNDVESAVAIAHVCGCAFVRCNVYVGAAVTDQGIIEGAAREALAARRALDAGVRIWADVGVKHAVILGNAPIADQASDAVERGLADALIVTGPATGSATPIERIREAKDATNAPVLVGSGLTAESAPTLLSVADGAIVGTSIKRDGRPDAPVDADRVRALMRAVAGARSA